MFEMSESNGSPCIRWKYERGVKYLELRLRDSGVARKQINRPEDVVALFGEEMRGLPHEEFRVIVLDGGSKMLTTKVVTVGTLNASLVHPRECFWDAVIVRGASVVFVHNHPSGNDEPSREDIAITRQLVDAGKVLGIQVLDHIIIGDGFTSMDERGLINPEGE